MTAYPIIKALPVILRVVCKHSACKLFDIRSDRRSKTLVRARWAVWWLMAQNTTASIARVGRILNRDHTTVLHAMRGIRAMDADDPFRAQLAVMNAEVGKRLRGEYVPEARAATADVLKSVPYIEPSILDAIISPTALRPNPRLVLHARARALHPASLEG